MAVRDFEYEFDPVKKAKDGSEAERVIWTTKALKTAVDALEKGLPLKVNPFCGKETKLLKPDLLYKRTVEEIEDYKRCMLDPIYFASKCFLMTPEGLKPCRLRDYQVAYLKHLQENHFSIFLACRQCGKSVTTAIYCLWVILFNNDKKGLVLSKSGPAGRDVISKIKNMYMWLPYYLKCGTLKWNQSEISFDNNSTIKTEAFSPTAGLGDTINFLILDEFAWCPPNDVQLFYENVIPTVATMTDANVCIMSTQNGFNKFQELWYGAITHKNDYAPFKVDWDQVPQYNNKTKQWEKRDDAWKQMMIRRLGSEEAFNYQFGTQFAASDKCILSREALGRLKSNCNLYENPASQICALLYPNMFFVDPSYDVNKFKTNYYLVIADLAEGLGSDYTVFHIFELVFKGDNVQLVEVAYWRSNEIELEMAALEFWLLCNSLFEIEHYIVSIEWNTYGALFYNYIIQLNEREYKPEYIWRFNIALEFDTANVIHYKRGAQEDNIIGIQNRNTKDIPGIRFNSGNKKTACTLFKMEVENESIILTDTACICEIETFEDERGSGSYKARDGQHDDIVMTIIQIPLVRNSGRFKEFVDEIKEQILFNNKRDDLLIPETIQYFAF